MDNQKLIQAGFKELLQDETVIYAVLKKMRISSMHPSYDDFVSEARLLYLKAYVTNNREGKARFNYFFNKIYWGLIDLVKKDQRLKARTESDELILQADSEYFIDRQLDLEQMIEYQELISGIKTHCSDKEWDYLQKRLCGLSIKEISALRGVHHSAIYQIRQRLRKKFSDQL